MDLQPALCGLLQRHGRLCLYLLPDRQVQQTGCRVKPAPGGRAGRAVQRPLQHGRDGARGLFTDHGAESGHDLVCIAAGVQGRCSHAPGFSGSRIATGQGQWQQVTQPLKTLAVYQQDLAAPGQAIGAQTHAVQRYAKHRVHHVVKCAVLGQHCCDMGVVVLHCNGADTVFVRQPQGQVGAEEVWVQVVGHGIDGTPCPRQQRAHGLLQRLAGSGVGQVAMQHGPQRRAGCLGVEQTGGILEECATGQNACHGVYAFAGCKVICALACASSASSWAMRACKASVAWRS